MCKAATKAISSGVKLRVEWDEEGEPLGSYSAELKSYIATTTKRIVAITYLDWRFVPKTLKDMVWKEVLVGICFVYKPFTYMQTFTFISLLYLINVLFLLDGIILPKQKKGCLLKVTNSIWKRFKSDLTVKFMYDKDGEICASPPDQYKHIINLDEWTKFIEIRMSSEFKVNFIPNTHNNNLNIIHSICNM